jgi:DNA polymerase III gamma/tau subunit
MAMTIFALKKKIIWSNLLYRRKYRPQTFNDVVGQKAITNTLLNAIESNHLASALLFTGPRGWKKQLALILARKINQPGYDDPTKILLLMCSN